VTDLDWARGPDESRRAPGLDRPRSWKERPVDVRAEAAAQVGPQRRGEVIARRVAEWREQGEGDRAEPHRLRTPEVRRRRRNDPGYPSRWYLWRGEKGKSYVRAWESYSRDRDGGHAFGGGTTDEVSQTRLTGILASSASEA
jgi:hypothetical protein